MYACTLGHETRVIYFDDGKFRKRIFLDLKLLQNGYNLDSRALFLLNRRGR